jgi:hypothetical protein
MTDKFKAKLEATQFVYQYTSLEALFAILEGYRKSKRTKVYDFIPFRASCIYNVNDPREMELGFDAIKKFLPSFEKRRSNNLYLSEVYKDSETENRCREKCFDQIVDGMIEAGIVPYTSSFSRKRDFLPMWSLYGDSFKGACLVFDLVKIIDSLPLEGNMQFGFVSYEDDESEVDNLESFFPQLYEWVQNTYKTCLTIEDKIRELSVICSVFSPFFKGKDWAYESEFRIVCSKIYKIDFSHEYIKGLSWNPMPKKKVDPYVYYPIKANALQEIIIGSAARYSDVEHVLRNELNECLMNDVDITPSSIKIRL